MPKKRRSGGKTGSKKGRSELVSCSSCGKLVRREKAKKRTVYSSFVDYQIARELRAQGTRIPRVPTVKYYCVNCAVHRGIVHIRAKEERKKRE